MITRAKISAVRASGVRRLFEGGAFKRFCPRCGVYSGAVLINFFVPDAALIRGRRVHCQIFCLEYRTRKRCVSPALRRCDS